MDLTKPFDVAFPVNFYSGGDTTKDAFGKHIQEIERIYGIINALNADKLSASEFTTRLQNHIDDTNPHPNLELDNTKGNLPFSRITGNLDGSRITGEITNATINYAKINGLSGYVSSQIPSNAGITYQHTGVNGLWMRFPGGPMMQWGTRTVYKTEYEEKPISTTFPTPFSTYVSIVMASTEITGGDSADNMFQVRDITKTGFKYIPQEFDQAGLVNDWSTLVLHFFAIGM